MQETFDLHNYDKHVNTDDLLDKIREFANSSNRQAGKKERQKQKGHFKHIIHSIQVKDHGKNKRIPDSLTLL
jgi:hypothetical protein